MDIRKSALYMAEIIVGSILGGFLLLGQWIIYAISLWMDKWWLASFLLHFINGALILGASVVVGNSIISHWKRKKRRGIIADCTILTWLIFAIGYTWKLW